MSRSKSRGPLRPLFLLLSIVGLLGGILAAPVAAAEPDDPTNVAVAIANDGDGVTVTWTAGAENGDPITGFDVDLNGPDPDFSQAADGDTSITFTGMGLGSYTATVVATSDVGDSDPVDSGGSVTVAVPDAPPSVAIAANGADGVTVSWSEGGDNGSLTTEFVIHLVATGGGSAKPDKTRNPGVGAVGFSNLDPGTYSAQVWAVSDLGDSGTTSSAGTVVVNEPASAPDAPSVTLVLNGNDGVTVSWDPGNDNGSTVTGFAVDLNGSNGGEDRSAGQGPAIRTTNFNSLDPGTYTATVVTESDEGDSPGGASGSVVIDPPATNPDAPGSVTVTANNSQGVNVTWSAGAANGSNVSGFVIHLNASAGGVAPTNKTVGAGATSVSFSNLTPGKYRAVVHATSDEGPSDDASSPNRATVTEPATPPGAPTGAAASFSNDQVVASWTAPADDGGATVTSYQVKLLKGTTLIDTKNPSGTSVGFPVSDSGDYTVEVRARNSAGLSPSVVAPPDGGLVQVRIYPTKPRSVTASSASDQVTIDWDAPSRDGGTIDHYEITFDGQDYTVDHPDTVLLIGGVGPGTYIATVVAVNTFNLASGSQVSNEETVTVPPGAPSNVNGTADVRTVTVTWDEPASSGGKPVLSYTITLDGASQGTAAGVRTATFTDVSLGEHHAEVYATTAEGPGAKATSNVFEVKRAFHPFESNGNFVDQLYVDILGRKADTGGRNYWMGQLGNSDAKVPFVVNQFLSSAEFGPRRPIIRLYLAYFNRAPDTGGFDYWTGLFAGNKISLVDASFTFANSKEFEQTYGELNDGQFIVLVYNNVLGRRPDVPGFNFWINKLNRGLNRAELMLAFSESPEFQGSSANFVDITMVYRGMMNRIPDAQDPNNEYTVWLPRLAGSENVDDLIMDVFDSDEYEARIRP